MKTGPLTLFLADEQATARFGEDLAVILQPGDVVALRGDLGAGKTALARAIIRALAGDRDLDVPSPTFTLVQTYEGRLPVLHADLYRLGSPDEVEQLGLDDTPSGVVLVEWPEIAGARFADASIAVTLAHHEDGRTVELRGSGVERVARSLDIRDFLERSGRGDARRDFLLGDASARTYETASSPGEPMRILMNAPRRPDGPPIRDGLPYSRIAHLAESVVPFVAIDGILRERGFAAPEVLAQDLDRGLLLLEHLGGGGFLDAGGAPVEERYLAAAELLAALHRHAFPTQIRVEDGVIHEVPAYDRRAMTIETELVTDWYLPYVGIEPDGPLGAAFASAWSSAFDRLETAERTLVLRDYHSPNLIWRGDRSGTDRLGLIDFQDAVIGPSAYDVASLAQDARVTIPIALEAKVVETYMSARESDGPFDRDAFLEAYAITGAQRNSKILGIFVRLNERDGKPGYLRHLPRMRDYLARSLRHPALHAVESLYRETGILEPALA